MSVSVLAACSVAPVTFTPAGGPPGDAAPAIGAPGDLIWARSTSAMAPYRARLGPGGLVVAGSFNAPTTLGTSTFVPVGDYDMAVVGVAPGDASLLYATRFGGVGYEAAFVDTLDPGGAPILHGITNGVVDIGTGMVSGGGGSDTFIGRYGAGPPAWTHRLATPDEDKIIATGPGPAGSVYATGYFVTTATIGATVLTSSGGRDVMVLRFNTATGALELARTFIGSGRNEGGGIVWQGGATYVSGLFDGTMLADMRAVSSAGGLDAFVARLDNNGAVVWLTRLGGAGNEFSPSVAVDAAGDVYLAGTFQGEFALGGTRLTSVGSDDIFLAKLKASDGTVLAASSLGSPGSDNVLGLAVDAGGKVAIAGNAGGVLGLGGGNQGGLDAFVACYDGVTQLRWSKVIGTAGDDRGWSVSFGSDGALYATVTVAGTVDLGMPLIGPANPVGIVLKLVP